MFAGAVNENNRMPWYAELCPAMFGVTYSNGQGDRSVVSLISSELQIINCLVRPYLCSP